MLNGLLPDPSMRLMALEGIERILALGERYVRTGYSPGGSLALSEHAGGLAPRNTAGFCACCSNAAARHTKILTGEYGWFTSIPVSYFLNLCLLRDTAARNNTRPQLDDVPHNDAPILCGLATPGSDISNSAGKHLAIEDSESTGSDNNNKEEGALVHKSIGSNGHISTVGSAARVNPFASQLSVRNLQLMSNSCKSAHISKRVSKIFKDHFMSCALCRQFFSKHTSEVSYCAECKGNVCNNCDCSKYHLSFQELMWNDLEGPSGGGSSSSSKKSKKKKKQKKKKNVNDTVDRSTSVVEGNGNQKEIELEKDKDKEKEVAEASDSGSEDDLSTLVVAAQAAAAQSSTKKSKKQKKKERDKEKKNEANNIAGQSSKVITSSGLVTLADYSDVNGIEQENDEAFTAVEGRRRGKHGAGAATGTSSTSVQAAANQPKPSSAYGTASNAPVHGSVGVTVVRSRAATMSQHRPELTSSGDYSSNFGSKTNSSSSISGSGRGVVVRRTQASDRSNSLDGSTNPPVSAWGTSSSGTTSSYAAVLGNSGRGSSPNNNTIAATAKIIGGPELSVNGINNPELSTGSAMTMPSQTPRASHPVATSSLSMNGSHQPLSLPSRGQFGIPQRQLDDSPPGLGSLGLDMGLDIDIGFRHFGGPGGTVNSNQGQLDPPLPEIDMGVNFSALLGGLGGMTLSDVPLGQEGGLESHVDPARSSLIMGSKMDSPGQDLAFGLGLGGGGLLAPSHTLGGLDSLHQQCDDSISISQAEALLRDDDDGP